MYTMFASSTNGINVVKLRSSDHKIFIMDEAMAVKSKTIKDMFEDCMDDDLIPIPNINVKTLCRIIKRCKNHTDNKITIEKLKKLDDELVPINPDILYDLIPAANYLNIKDLLDQGIQRAANMMKSKSPKEIHLICNIQNDFTY
ncbi:SKP1-like protein 1B [Ziziphus jujuba]|uniref:SKP1-like protein n=1 Tax=Ziziphus jujuba TaxID=326968 RepID=A0A6P4ABS6_ZIZJJ|nr:SKP1-like protein 1B [Ziziphus jujuba]